MDEKTILSSVLTFYIGSCEQVIKICVIHITILEKKGNQVGKQIIFTQFCLQVSKHIRVCVYQCQTIYYLEAQTQTMRCPSMFEEMKCNLMLNKEEFLSLHSYNFNLC